jgi:hypothetical protein
MPGNDKRRFSRIPVDGIAHLRCSGGNEWSAELIDISLKGALISRPAGFSGELDAHCRLDLELGGGAVQIDMEGAIAHLEADHIGFRCEHIGLESVSHLKRLLELNLGDEALLERELTELAAGA